MDLPDHLPSITLLVRNMHCPTCVESITSLLAARPSIRDLSVNLLLRTVTFRVDTSLSGSLSVHKNKDEVVEDIKRVLASEGGFQIESDSPHHSSSQRHATQQRSSSGWMEFLDFPKRRKQEKARREEEERRSKHLERCEACRLGLEHPDNPPSFSQPVGETDDRGKTANGKPTDGKPTDTVKTTLSISGMTCASCTASIHGILTANPDVLQVSINLLSSSGVVRHRSTLPASEIRELIEDGGFEAEVTASEPEESPAAGAPRLLRSVFAIHGMTCASCSSTIDGALRPLDGVKEVSIDLLGNRGTIVHSSAVTAEQLKEAIEDTGYDAELVETRQVETSPNDSFGQPDTAGDMRKVTIRVEGIFCNNCVTSLNAYLATLPLLSYTEFTSTNHTTTVAYKPHDPLDIRQILKGLADVAPEFHADIIRAQSLSDRSRGIQQREFRILAAHLTVAFVFAIPTFIVAIVGMVLLPGHNGFRSRLMTPVWGAANIGTIVLWPLATVVQFGVGRLFYERTLHSLYPLFRLLLPRALLPLALRRTPKRPFTWRALFTFGSMDLLVVLSTSTSYFASLAMLILDVRAAPTSQSVGTYFDSCVFLIMFILLGRTLESYAKSKTTDSVSLLGQLRPESALLVDPGRRDGKDRGKVPDDDMSSHEDNEPHEDMDPHKDRECHAGKEKETDEARGSHGNEKGQNHAVAKLEQTDTGSTEAQHGPTSRAIPVEHLEIGDLILVPPGSLPPTDGVVVSGQSTFDESSLTGESRPVVKSPKDEVFTGTTNLTSAIVVRVTRVGGSTMLEKIISAVSDASSRKAPLEKMAERLTGVFVPMIVYLALTVLAIWLSIALTGHLGAETDRPGGRVFSALEFAIATLVVACPCGIGLAVPCANAVGTGLAAKNGILAVGGGEAFVGARKVGAVLLDKTGTITEGRSRVTDEVVVLPDPGQGQAILLAVQEIERGSTHPLAQGLVEYLQKRGDDHQPQHRPTLEVLETEEIAGRGLKAQVRNQDKNDVADSAIELLIGNVLLLADNGVDIDMEVQKTISAWSERAKSVVLVASRRLDSPSSATTSTDTSVPSTPTTSDQASGSVFSLAAMFALADPPREASLDVIRVLRERGTRVMMLSGDNEATARAVGRMVGIEQNDVRAGVGPEGKAEVIREVQGELAVAASRNRGEERGWGRWWRSTAGDKVMFVGDGLNDSVALAAADVSVAMGHGSQSTLAGADFVLLNSSLSTLLPLLTTSRKVTNRQILNLAWAIIFNLVCLPFAAGVFYPAGGIRLTPVWSAVLMALSSVSVVCSSLALRWGF